jgi:hypothetical protein
MREVRVIVTDMEGMVLDTVEISWDDKRVKEICGSDPITKLRIIPTDNKREIIPTHPAECDLIIGK